MVLYTVLYIESQFTVKVLFTFQNNPTEAAVRNDPLTMILRLTTHIFCCLNVN